MANAITCVRNFHKNDFNTIDNSVAEWKDFAFSETPEVNILKKKKHNINVNSYLFDAHGPPDTHPWEPRLSPWDEDKQKGLNRWLFTQREIHILYL